MHHVSIKPQWSIRRPDGGQLPARLIDLLVDVDEHGSLMAACQKCDLSYRHAWDLVRQGEALFGTPLLVMTRGKGSKLTPLAEKLVWADRRIAARLTPALEALASELEVEIERALSAPAPVLRIQASHGFAISKLHELLAREGVPVELKYGTSLEAVAALHGGDCELAGFHVPVGEFQGEAARHYSRWFDTENHRLIHLATRRQGFMVAAGNPRKLYDVADLARPGVRFINRQPGSGTRYLLDLLLREAGIDSASIAGYEQGEYTHAAVAAYVASGMADVGFGVETPARQFKLDFLPVQSERYFLLCQQRSLDTPLVQRVRALMDTPTFHEAIDSMAGYRAQDVGRVLTIGEAFPELAQKPVAAPPAPPGPSARRATRAGSVTRQPGGATASRAARAPAGRAQAKGEPE